MTWSIASSEDGCCTRHRLANIAAAFGWMGLRLLVAGAFARKWWALGFGALFVGVAYAALRIAADREEFDRIGKGWRP